MNKAIALILLVDILKLIELSYLIVRSYCIDDTWQLDLADMQKYQGENKPYKWIFICIDIFSKYVWVMLQKSKSGPETTKAFQEILKNSNGRKPKHIQVDEGN